MRIEDARDVRDLATGSYPLKPEPVKSEPAKGRFYTRFRNCPRCVAVAFLFSLASWLVFLYVRSRELALGQNGGVALSGLLGLSTGLAVVAGALSWPHWTNALWRRLVFFGGDIRSLGAFPWFTWAQGGYLIDFDEILPALPLVKYGDIGLHRSKGFLSNFFIPGFMKHAWIHVQDGIEIPEIVEAVSEGVVRRNAIHPILSDYTIILTPREEAQITDEHRKGACLKAKQIIGAAYDPHFRFNIDEELKYYEGMNVEEAKRDLEVGKEQIRNYHIAFSCTEVVAYAWWHRRESLGITRQRRWGKDVILADSFLNDKWRIKWASAGVTPEVARKMGLPPEGIKLIEEYRRETAPKPEVSPPPAAKQSRV